jgi:NAD(P)-dependent dehydrogenase (short-subunit alcohol dehydrogenase family)
MSEETNTQVAVVTGGAGGESGLGLTTAEALLRIGVRVAILGQRSRRNRKGA